MPSDASKPIKLSFVVPILNEAESLETLVNSIEANIPADSEDSYEIILVDDGSDDNSWEEIIRIHDVYENRIQGLRFRRNFGKAAALQAGFDIAKGDIVFTLDADLQDDPTEIPNFIQKLEEGYDIVSGWKQSRQDPASKTLPSKLFNFVTRAISGVPLHDFNCGFKAYRLQAVKSIKLYGELHRYIPIIANELGFRIGELPVKHYSRVHGVSKYGWGRFFSGFLDLITVIATTRYLKRPAHLFGGLGLFIGIAGIAILGYLSFLWFTGEPIGNRPLFFLGILNLILSMNLISLGILAEIITRKNNTDDQAGWIAERLDTLE